MHIDVRKVQLHEPLFRPTNGPSKKVHGKCAAEEEEEEEEAPNKEEEEAPNDQGHVSGRARRAGELENKTKQRQSKPTVIRTRDSAKLAQASDSDKSLAKHVKA